jgi:hypothetical protein
MSYEDDDRYWEAQQEGSEEEAYDRLYKEIGPQWVRDHADELFQEHYEEAVSEFTSERLKSFYLKHPDLARPAWDSLLSAQSLMPSFPQAAIVFAVTAAELVWKKVLLEPIVFGLVHSEGLANFVTELATEHKGMGRFKKLLTAILTEFGGVDLMEYKRLDSPKTLWEEIGEIQKARNRLVHEGKNAPDGTAGLAISVAETLLNFIFPEVITKLGLHLHNKVTVCGSLHREDGRITVFPS